MARQGLGVNASGDTDLIGVRALKGVYSQCKNGEWTSSSQANSTAATFVSGNFYGSIFIPARDCSVDQIGVNVTTSGASASLRLGIYEVIVASDGGMTTSLVVDGGTVSATTTGIKTVSFTAVNLKYGRVYMVGVVMVAGSTPQIRFTHGPLGLEALSATTSAIALATAFGVAYWCVGVGTGALPSTPTITISSGLGPHIAIHCSA